MTVKFNKPFFASSLMLLSIEICITAFLTEGFIRHTFGDYLAVILIYCAIRSILNIKPIYVAIGVLIFSFSIESLQLFNLLDYLHLRDNNFAVIVLGSTFETTDLIAYSLGIITIYLIDTKINITWIP
ncbi:ribosomal maturation YjgA family protein [Psychroserpens sp. MEBiC05023]